MSPKVLESDGLIFWFHSYDAIHESRASVYIGKGTQDDINDAKVWREPEIEVGREGRTLKAKELRKALCVIEENHDYLPEEWRGYGK